MSNKEVFYFPKIEFINGLGHEVWYAIIPKIGNKQNWNNMETIKADWIKPRLIIDLCSIDGLLHEKKNDE